MSAQHNRNSPHLSNHLQNGSNPPSPSMSNNQQQQGGQSRQAVSYPSPTSYPSPSMSNAQFNYPPPNNQQNEPYRASPTGSNGSMSLPSMRSLDPLQQQQQAQHNMASSLPPPVAQMGGQAYYQQHLPHPGHQYGGVTSDPNGGNMRFALPGPDSRVMSGGRHKKEIKRRTKTGCLTCRKRRIKCDEAHPACRNCQKSKRECLGYDPIFKNNPGPAPIQPAPSSAPQQATQTITAGNGYGNQPPMSGYNNMAPMGAYDPALTAGIQSPSSAAAPFEYSAGPAIDPALEAAVAAPYHAPIPVSTSLTHTATPGKRWSMKDLLTLGGAPPAPHPASHDASYTPALMEEMKHLFYSIYAPGIESFLESRWYSVKGAAHLLTEQPVIDLFANLIDLYAKTRPTDVKQMAYTTSVETRVIWALANMVKTTSAKSESKPELPNVDDPVESALRLDVVEALLTGEVAPGNSLTKSTPDCDSIRQREMDFWHALGEFVAIDYETATHSKEIDDTLGTLRNLLDGRENRDVLYSIAVVRAIGHRVSEYTVENTPHHLDESDNRSKLHVAKKFVVDEANGGGTTNVIRRLCELTAKTWTQK